MQSVRQSKFVLFATFLMILGTAGPLRADTGATAKVRSVLGKAMEIQTNPALQGTAHRRERAARIRKLISKNFLSSEMAKESMQGYWGRLSASQRAQYEKLLTAIFIDSYTRQVVDFLKQEKIQYPGETPEGSYTKVKTVIMRTNEHIPVDYVMQQSGGQWMIRDVLIDGVGIVETYKSSFASFLRSHPFSDLIKRMQIQQEADKGL